MQSTKNIEDLRWTRAKVHIGVIAVTAAFAISLLSQDVRFHELNRELQALEAERVRCEEERIKLNLCYEKSRNPARIRAIAGTDLGMITPNVTNVRNLERVE